MLVLLLILGLVVYSYYIGYKVKKTKQQMDFVLERILDPEFDVEGFMRKNKESLNKFEFSQKEIGILKDNFEKTYTKDQTEIPENSQEECAICLGIFEPNEKIIDHPICNHRFHTECLSVWLEKHKLNCVCPICKSPTRENMIS